MDHIRSWVAAVGMEVVRAAVCMVLVDQRKLAVACYVEVVESLVVVVRNLVVFAAVRKLEEVERKFAAVVAAQSLVVFVDTDLGGLAVAMFVVIVVAAECLVDVFLAVVTKDLEVIMFVEVVVIRVAVGVLTVDPIMEEAYEAVQAANFDVLAVVEEAYVVNPMLTAAAADCLWPVVA